MTPERAYEIVKLAMNALAPPKPPESVDPFASPAANPLAAVRSAAQTGAKMQIKPPAPPPQPGGVVYGNVKQPRNINFSVQDTMAPAPSVGVPPPAFKR